MKYRVEIAPQAERELSRLDEQTRKRVAHAIDALADNPRPRGVIGLAGAKKGAPTTYRCRVGDYRILYQTIDRELLVLVVHVGSRGGVYKGT